MKPCRGKGRERLTLKVGTLLLATLSVAACGTGARISGNMPDPDVVAEIRPGASRQGDVAGLLGSPSAVSPFENRTWYYIGQRMESFAFFKPTVLERRILVVSFSDSGVVESLQTLNLADGRDIDPVGRVTPTEGQDFTILQQIFGNLGRFPTDEFQGN